MKTSHHQLDVSEVYFQDSQVGQKSTLWSMVRGLRLQMAQLDMVEDMAGGLT